EETAPPDDDDLNIADMTNGVIIDGADNFTDQSSAAGNPTPSDAEAADQLIALAPSVTPATDVCVSLGPFANEDLAAVAADRLRILGYDPATRETGGQIRSGYWVYLPPHASRQEARDNLELLRARGVRDLFVVTGSDQSNAISLGLFSTAQRADQRAAEIGKLGFSPRIAERFRDATVFWLDYTETGDNPLSPQSVGVFADGDQLPERVIVECE
ncbi:MAG: SPOR domain-containing protein, partial [Gammaproteobacteria bacterium]|nr:SPOR domain-containing protein [Gammaproteobacteria bacterium]